MTQVSTPQENAEELIEAFEMFDDWEDRYRFLIDAAKSLPPLPAAAKVEENRVHGCQSNVWMIAETKLESGETRIEFLADSDSVFTRGMVALVHRLYSNQTPRDILNFDIEGFLQQLELDQHLSMGRRNGLDGMVKRVKTIALQSQ
ncbi:Cysteine desulfuration protein SufE [Abditibacterium utsteinense]|uniref:Cysteine desulfuration protein SufE n=1 Tax=Abditibacterium utsteinense TaxID=1960156 RepID=A0A2S8SWR3_9BACT|nr:SufE family protein [Abditibacterium utsteinense]PQV65227.1 Cysteine desulfuration protein SufE [Abditibacterium utsteinense]